MATLQIEVSDHQLELMVMKLKRDYGVIEVTECMILCEDLD